MPSSKKSLSEVLDLTSIKKDLQIEFFFFTQESYRDFEVNFLVLRKKHPNVDCNLLFERQGFNGLLKVNGIQK